MSSNNHFRENLIVTVCAVLAIACLSSALEMTFEYDYEFFDVEPNIYSAIAITLNQTDPFLITGINEIPSYMKEVGVTHFVIATNSTDEAYECQTSYIPKRISLYFPSLLFMEITNVGLQFIAKEDFFGMEKMTNLSLNNNLIKSIPTDAFSTMLQLKTLHLDGNKLEIIENNLFKFNGELEFIALNDNNIKYIGYRSFLHLNALTKVLLSNNDCIDFVYETGHDLKASITQFNYNIRTGCGDKAVASEIYMNEIEKLMDRVKAINLQLKDDHGMKLMKIVEKN